MLTEKERAYHRAYYAKNRDAVREYRREHRKRNIDKYLAYAKKYRDANAEKHAAYNKAYYEERRDLIAFRQRKKKYGVGREEFFAMIASQGGLCAMCKKPLPKNTSRIAVDHDHATGSVRGLLHTRCNVGLGFYELNAEHIAAYLFKAGKVYGQN